MRGRALALTLSLALLPALVAPPGARGQIVDRIKRSAERTVANELSKKIDDLLRDAIRCVVGDSDCYEKGKESGDDVIFVDDEGEVITDEDGVPVTDPDQAEAMAPPQEVPGEGVWANYDFVPGDDILFYDDWSRDDVGDFPRRLNFVKGNWEIVEWEGRRFLRNTGRRYAAVEIPLPEDIPQRFTLEFDAYMPHPNHRIAVATYSPAADGHDSRNIQGNFFQVGTMRGTGVAKAPRSDGVESVVRTDQVEEEIVPIRIMVDGSYAKVYVGSQRVANVPNAELRRGNTLYLENMYMNNDDNPIYIGPIRLAAGGADLYDDLVDDGRAVTRGILFAVNSDRIRPESTPTLEEITDILQEHPDLSLRIEGHTDADGEEAYNQELSERRAESVKSYLVSQGIAGERLETAGMGESQPVADNDTAEGKQKNRRVELVRLDQGGEG